MIVQNPSTYRSLVTDALLQEAALLFFNFAPFRFVLLSSTLLYKFRPLQIHARKI